MRVAAYGIPSNPVQLKLSVLFGKESSTEQLKDSKKSFLSWKTDRFSHLHNQVGERKGNEIRRFLMSRIMILIRLFSLTLHFPCLCLILVIE